MSTPILATKLYIPPLRPQAIRRPRLIQKLNEGLQHRKLTLISAAAGFGKTTLVSEWVNWKDEGRRMKDELNSSGAHLSNVAWLSLDEGDNEPTRFFAYFIAALQTVDSKIGEGAMALLQSPQPPPIETILTTLLNEITAASTGSANAVTAPFLLVLDDYHLLDSPPIDQALTFLLEHQPPQMHLVIATREDPSFPLARYRVRHQLTELRAADLRFDAGETAVFLNQAMNLNLSVADINALENRTEGWIAGLQLAALALQGQPQADQFIQTFTGSHHFVLDYLIEEVLNQQPENVQIFLLSTSILERLCVSLCDTILRDLEPSGQEILAYLERANLFIIPLDNVRRWYRYHHLFGDLLRQRVKQNAAISLPDLHSRASLWFEENELNAEAVHHALAAEDFERTANLLELIYLEMDDSFQTKTWLEWANRLPKTLFHNRPVLLVNYAWAHINNGKMVEGKAYLEEAEQMLGKAPRAELVDADSASQELSPDWIIVDEDQFRLLPATISSAHGYHAQVMGDHAGAVRYAEQTVKLLPEEEYVRRILAAGSLATSYWAYGDLEAAHQTFVELTVNLRKAGHYVFATATTYGLSIINITRGYLYETIQLYKQTAQFAEEQGETTIQGHADQYLWLCDLYLEQGELELARQSVVESEKLGEQAALPDWWHRLYLAQAKIKEAEGDFDGALKRLDQSEAAYYPVPVPRVQPTDARKARIWLKQDKLSDARSWVKAKDLSVDDGLNYLREYEHITLARVLIAEGKYEEAGHLLHRLLTAAEDGKRIGSMIEILILQAINQQAQGNATEALEPLEQALTLAAPENYIRLFTDEGQAMQALLERQKAEGKRQKDFVQKLLTFFDNQDPIQPSSFSLHPSLIEPLSERELEVLQLVAQGLSNREISEQLFLAVDTVKGHNRRIFGKLQVQNRTEAARRARELGLL